MGILVKVLIGLAVWVVVSIPVALLVGRWMGHVSKRYPPPPPPPSSSRNRYGS